jgi:hypothetical protein
MASIGPRRASPALVWLVAVLSAAVLVIYLCRWSPAQARDYGQYADAAPAVRDWYKAQELTPAAQQRFAFKSCCDNSDVVRTQFRVNSGSGADEWFWLHDGKWERIPDDVIHWGEVAPGGQAVMFALDGRPTCFYPAESGN